ncbi:MAG: hypothetical protein AAGG48_11865 [Planctomycetota bacterium]
MSTGSNDDQVGYDIPPIKDFYAWAEQYGIDKAPEVAALTDVDYDAIEQTIVKQGEAKAKQVLADENVSVTTDSLDIQATVSEAAAGNEAYLLAVKEARRLYIEAGKREQNRDDDRFKMLEAMLSEAESTNANGDRDGALSVLQQVVDLCKLLTKDSSGDNDAADIPISEAGDDIARDDLEDEILDVANNHPPTQIVDDEDVESLYGNPPIQNNDNDDLNDAVVNAFANSDGFERQDEDVESLFGNEDENNEIENNYDDNENNNNLNEAVDIAFANSDGIERDDESLSGGESENNPNNGPDDGDDSEENENEDSESAVTLENDDQEVIEEMNAETLGFDQEALDNTEAQLYSNKPLDGAPQQALNLRKSMLNFYQKEAVADWPPIHRKVVDKNRADAEKKFSEKMWDDSIKGFLHTIKTMSFAVNQRNNVRKHVQSGRDVAELITDKNNQAGSPERFTAITEELDDLVGNLDRYERELTTAAFDKNLAAAMRDSRKIEGLYRKIGLGDLLDLMTIDVQQGDYFAKGHDHPLLEEIDMAGVCMTMVLDWMAGDGSMLNPGDAQKAEIDSHLVNSQVQYSLTLKVLGRGRYRQNEVIKHLKLDQKAKVAEEAHEQAKLLLAGVADHHRIVVDRVDECAQQASDAAAYIRRTKATIDELTDAPNTEEKKNELKRLKQDVEFYSSEQYSLEKEAASWDDVEKVLGPLVKRVKKIVDTFKADDDEAAGILQGCKDQMLKMASSIFKIDQDRQGIAGIHHYLPDTQLKKLGLEVAPGGQELDLPENAEFFTSAAVVDFLHDKFINSTPVGESRLSQLAIAFPLQDKKTGYHVIGIRIEHPSDNEWMIEVMDPNFGGFKVSSLKDFKDLIKSLYENQYGSQWMELKAINLTSTKAGDGDDNGDQNQLDMVTDKHVKLADWEAAMKCYETVMDIANMPIRPRNELLTLRDSTFKLMPVSCLPNGTSPNGHPDLDAMIDSDWLLAKSYTNRLREESIRLLQIYTEFTENKEESRSSIDWETETPAGVAWAQACATWVDGDINVANKKMKEALLLTVQDEFGGWDDDDNYDDL